MKASLRYSFLSAAILSLSTLGACSSNDNDALPTGDGGDQLTLPTGLPVIPATPGGDITPIAGLYDARRIIGTETDERYALFDATGLFTIYDLEQDALGSGDNCYRPTAPVTVSPNGGDSYSIDERVTTIVRTETGIDLTFTDSTDEDEDGDLSETLTQSWLAVAGIVIDDLLDCRAAE
jgi:hypothetical protein